jgi:ADP-ribose pyrophosphatase
VQKNNIVRDGEGWQTKESERHFANEHLTVVTDCVKTPTQSKPRRWTTVHRKPAVIVAPFTSDGKIILIRQERAPIRATIWEVPAGQIDGSLEPDQPKIEASALRELREETGHELAPGGELVSLGHYFSSPGFTDEHGYFFLARPVRPCAGQLSGDESESILDCRSFTLVEFSRMIADGEICDANTLSIAARLATRGFLSLSSC